MVLRVGAAEHRAASATASRWMAVAAGLCSVHCLAAPFLALAAPFLVIAEAGEWWLWAGTALFSVLLLWVAPVRKAGVAALTGSGVAIWAGSLLGWFHPLPEFATSPVGSLLVAGGMVWSARLCRAASCEVGGGP